jgi:hypothetical protein
MLRSLMHSTPVLPTSNETKSAEIRLTLGYPSLVICESPSRKHGPECSCDFAADPSVYPWIDVYPSVAGEITRPLSFVSLRQPRARLAPHARTKQRKRFTADDDAPPVPKLPDYVTLQALSQPPPSPSQHSQKFSLQEHLGSSTTSICE